MSDSTLVQNGKPRASMLTAGELRSAAIMVNLLLWLAVIRAVQALV